MTDKTGVEEEEDVEREGKMVYKTLVVWKGSGDGGRGGLNSNLRRRERTGERIP